VLATVALFAALTGGATAAGIVAYAKHAGSANVAGNARHLDGKTAAQIAASARGPRGLQGSSGPAGPTGAAGAIGPAGPKGDTGDAGPSGSQGPKGDKGDVGAGLEIVGTVTSESALPSSGTTGDAYLVDGDLFVWTGAAWTEAGPVLGPKGDNGDTGATGPRGDQGPPGTAAVSIHTTAYTVAADDLTTVTGSCGAGQKAVSAGFDSNGDVFSADTQPTPADDGWRILLINADADNPASGTVYVVCLG
jgi:hypothetical protein